MKSFPINWGYGTGDWFSYMKKALASSCSHLQPCSDALPSGWGGNITDSFVQGNCSQPGQGGFNQSIGWPRTLYDAKTSSLVDAAETVVCADAGPIVDGFDRTSWIAYPDTCRIDSVACNSGCGADWANCSWTRSCGANKGEPRWATDPQFRKDNAKARHLGGSNIGFADGHAKWFAAEDILFGGENWSGYARTPTEFYGVGVCITPELKNRYR